MGTFLTDHFETLFDRIKAGLDRRLGLPLLRRKFKRILGYDLNLENPVTLNEKIQWLKFNTTGNDYVRASDKLEMPHFVRELIGDEMCEGIFTEILLETHDPDTIDFEALPRSYVIKPSHGSGWLRIVTQADPPDADDLRRQCKSWLRRKYGHRQFEWPNLQIKPRIMVEELLDCPGQLGARDVKLHMLDGKIRRVMLMADRFGQIRSTRINQDWTAFRGQPDPPFEEVMGWADMQEIAIAIGQHFSYVRVDFLSTPTRFALNELTFFSESGLNPMSYENDIELGNQLVLPPSPPA